MYDPAGPNTHGLYYLTCNHFQTYTVDLPVVVFFPIQSPFQPLLSASITHYDTT